MKILIVGMGPNQIRPIVELHLQHLQERKQNVVEDTTEFDAEMWRKYIEDDTKSSSDRLQEYKEIECPVIFHSGNLEFAQKIAEKYREQVDELNQLAELILSPMGQEIREVTKFDLVPKGYDATLIDPKQNHRPWEESKKELLRRRSRNLSRKLAQKNGRKRK